MNLDSIFILAAAGSTFVKYIVDGISIAWPTRPSWVPIPTAFVLGVAVIALLQVATNVQLTPSAWAQTVLAGIASGAGAAGLTATSNTAQSKRSDAKDAG